MERRPLVPLIVTIVWGLFLVPGLVGALLSPMMFDAPGSMHNPAAIFFVLVILSFPVLCVLSIAGTWVSWKFDSGVAQVIAACLPLVPVGIVVLNMVVGMIVGVATEGPPGLHTTVIEH